MYTFRMLGSIDASDTEHRDVNALLRQPKHVALLAYLALPSPGVWHRRDSVLGVLWGELEQTRARSALRSALSVLRRHLPEGAILARGDEELSLDASRFVTDVAQLLDDEANGRYGQALVRYAGELLPGTYVPDAPAFDKWLEQERNRVRAVACRAAARLSEQLDQSGELPGAIAAARRGAELSPDDEAATRRLIMLLDRAGDRAGAFAVYERFRNHMSAAFGVRPSAETVALLDAVRTRREVVTPTGTATGASTGPAPSPPLSPPSVRSVSPASPASRASPGSPAEHGRVAGALNSRISRPHMRRATMIGALVIAAAALAAVVRQPSTLAAVGSPASRVLVVLPMINQTGDTTYDYVATAVATGIARRLHNLGGLTVRSGAQSRWSDSIRADYSAIAREYGASTLLKTTLAATVDSFEVRVDLVDSSGAALREVARRRFVLSGMRQAESKLAAAIAADVFRKPMAGDRDTITVAQGESYRLTMQGLQLLLNYGTASASFRGNGQSMPDVARQLFRAAVELDPTNAAAHSGISSTYAIPTLNDLIPFDDGYRMTALAANTALAMDSTQAASLANLAITTALKSRSLAAGLPLMDAATKADPSNTEMWIIKSSLFRHAHLYDEARDAIRVARALDPFTALLLDREAVLEICANDPAAALELYRKELVLSPSDPRVHAGMSRSLALLGRYDDALEWWRNKAVLERDTVREQDIGAVRGAEGYWQLVHADGEKRLQTLLARQQRGIERVSSIKLMQAYFASGEISRGFAELAKLEEAQVPALFRLTCMPELDEVRSDARFTAALQRIGALPQQ